MGRGRQDLTIEESAVAPDFIRRPVGLDDHHVRVVGDPQEVIGVEREVFGIISVPRA
jgi:hypothetical protein